MSPAQHTPGPWHWYETWLVDAHENYVLDYAGCGSHECSASDADRALIAAAPELLALLERLVAAHHHANVGYYFESVGRQIAMEAVAAIAKAKGGTA